MSNNKYVDMYKVRVEKIRSLSEDSPLYFYPYKDEDKEDIHIYAMGVCLDLKTPIMKRLIKQIEKFFSLATKEERKKDFSEFDFDKKGRLILNERAKKLGNCQLVFETDDFPKKTLFLNGADIFQYYNADDLENNVGEIISKLVEADLIYKKRVKVDVTDA